MDWLDEAIAMEKRGEKERAFAIYHKLLAIGECPLQSKIGIVRTRHEWIKFGGLSLEDKLFFQEAQGGKEFQELERWLIK